jgi:2-amino-4-hydroxy-6-hydroxymethyldihydropteridine diphosphokinase
VATIYLGLGSNVEPEMNLSRAVQELRQHYDELDASAVYRSAAIGFEGDDFLNLVVRIQSDETVAEVVEEIERLHDLSGRVRGGNKWVARPLDIDLLLYDDLVIDEPGMRVPRSDVLEYSFVLRPLAELAPEFSHPVTGRTMLEHWREFDAAAHPLELVGVVL